MVSNLILFGGIFFLFYLLSFFARIEIDFVYWVAVAALGIYSSPIKSHILKENFYDFACYHYITIDDAYRLTALVVNGLLVVVFLGFLLVRYFIEI